MLRHLPFASAEEPKKTGGAFEKQVRLPGFAWKIAGDIRCKEKAMANRKDES